MPTCLVLRLDTWLRFSVVVVMGLNLLVMVKIGSPASVTTCHYSYQALIDFTVSLRTPFRNSGSPNPILSSLDTPIDSAISHCLPQTPIFLVYVAEKAHSY